LIVARKSAGEREAVEIKTPERGRERREARLPALTEPPYIKRAEEPSRLARWVRTV